MNRHPPSMPALGLRHRTLALLLLSAAGALAAPHDEQMLGKWENVTQFRWVPSEPFQDRTALIPVRLPADARYFTLVIDDQNGRRVRNLVSMGATIRYVDLSGMMNDPGAVPDAQTLTVAWNGQDDAGISAPVGTYRAHGLYLPGLTATFDYAWYNPGSPPWEGYPNSEWLGDHGGPATVACIPPDTGRVWRVLLGAPCAEGGHNVLALDEQMRKVWSFKRSWWGPSAMEISGDEVWLNIANYNVLMKLKLDSGQVATFRRPAGRIGELKFEDAIKDIAVGTNTAAVLLTATNRIVFLDKRRGRRTASVILPGTAAITFDPRDNLYASTSKGFIRVATNGSLVRVKYPGLGEPGVAKFAPDGSLYIMDNGPDHQIKIYSPRGSLVKTLGTTGSQKGLRYDPSALRVVSDLALDAGGQVWVVEPNHPRRASLWSADGTLVRDFVGNAQYGASHIVHHEQDPTLALGYGVIFQVDPSQAQSYRPLRMASSGRKAPDDPFAMGAGTLPAHFHRPMFFRSAVSGTLREYILDVASGSPVLYLDKGGDYRPVAALGRHANLPAFPMRGDDPNALSFWSDRNENERVEADEMQPLPGETAELGWFYGWSYLTTTGLAFYVQRQALTPVGFTASGAPLYDVARARTLESNGSFLQVGHHLVGTQDSAPFRVGRYRFLDMDGRLLATYPMHWMGVHSSMSSPVPKPGQTCGELFFSGVVDGGPELGAVVAAHGNMGQAFLFTETGLFISSLFTDCRNGPAGKGPAIVKGADWTNVSMQQEPFGGWFGKQSDGRTRYMFGRCEASVVDINGLENVRRFEAGTITLGRTGTVTVTPATPVAFVPSTTPARPAQSPPAKTASAETRSDPAGEWRVVDISARAAPWSADGDATEWKGLTGRRINAGENRVAVVALAHDATRLFVLYNVTDHSPLLNAARDPTLYFKQGDAVDLMLGPESPARGEPVAGDLRLLMAPVPDGFKAVLYRAVVPGVDPAARVEFSSPVRAVYFDSVQPVSAVAMAARKTDEGYILEAAIPFDLLGIRPQPGLRLRGDAGVLSSNEGGILTERRRYVFNQEANIVADTPSEAELQPAKWGILIME